jgi:transposase
MSAGRVSGARIPAATARAAWAANPKGTPAMWVRDRLNGLFADADFVDWFPTDGRPGVSAARLALVSVLQFAEDLSDRQAALAVRCRIDWKYCLGLELGDPGFDYSVLSEFRDRVAEGDRADQLLAVMVDRLVDAALIKTRGRVRTDSTHVLAAVRTLNRPELVTETLRAALEELAIASESWLAGVIDAEWGRRYGRAARYDRLPKDKAESAQYVLQVGADGIRLLDAVYQPDTPPRLRDLPQVQVLRQVWIQQYWTDADGTLAWRGPKNTADRQSRRTMPRRNTGTAGADGRPDPATARVPWAGMEIVTPHDAQARYSQKLTAAGQRAWIGYRDQQTETCDEVGANVIVHVVTQPAPEQDIDALDRIHTGLAAEGLHPVEHFVDAAYVTPATIHRSAEHFGIALIGPVRADPHATRHPGFTKADFVIDWETHTVTCPNNVTSPPWKPTSTDGHPAISVLFPRKACRECTDRQVCTGNLDGKGRHLLLMPQPLQEIQTRARAEQQTADWQRHYAIRAGCEATVSETVHAHGLRHCRYKGQAKTHVQHVLTAAGANIIRLSQYDPPENHPRPTRRTSHLQQLCSQYFSS